jgi:3-deoxy-D-manno-octulosonic acid (KDO) 8-phosphate synthase
METVKPIEVVSQSSHDSQNRTAIHHQKSSNLCHSFAIISAFRNCLKVFLRNLHEQKAKSSLLSKPFNLSYKEIRYWLQEMIYSRVLAD